MNEKQEIIQIRDLKTKFNKEIIYIRRYFYSIFSLIIKEGNINDNTNNNKNGIDKNDIINELKKLKEQLQEMKNNLNYLNNPNILTVDDKLLESIFDRMDIRINLNYMINNNIKILYHNYLSKRKILILYIIHKEPNILKLEKNENNDKNIVNDDENIVNDDEIKEKYKQDINEIKKYIESWKSNNKNYNIDVTLQYIDKNNIQIITKYFIFELYKSSKYFFDGTTFVNVKLKYNNTKNILLTSKIEELISEDICYLSEKIQNEKDNFIKYTTEFVKYICSYDRIFNAKCLICFKHAKYSFDDKGFIPPYMMMKNKQGTLNFYHPQCTYNLLY